MNEVIESLFTRKSVRAFSDELISDEEKRIILESCMQAPSGGNEEAYSIIDVTDQSIKDQLAELCDHQPFIAKAPMVLIFVTDKQRTVDLIREYEDPNYKPDPFDMNSNDAIIAAMNATMAAWSLGIGSCFIGDIKENFEIIQELFHLPQYVIPSCMLVLGRPTQNQLDRKKPNRFKLEDMVHENYYHKKSIEQTKQMYYSFTNKDEEGLKAFIHRLYTFKITSPFKKEMIRSQKAALKSWSK